MVDGCRRLQNENIATTPGMMDKSFLNFRDGDGIEAMESAEEERMTFLVHQNFGYEYLAMCKVEER
jgi:hypothetical protein